MSKDLFDESTMSFGEHLEVLRVHLWRAVIGLAVAICFAFFISKDVLLMVQAPVTAAMQRYFNAVPEDIELTQQKSAVSMVWDWFTGTKPVAPAATSPESQSPSPALNGAAQTTASQPAVSPSKTPEGAEVAARKTPRPNGSLVVEIDVVEIWRKLHDTFPKEFATAPPANTAPVLVPFTLTDKSHQHLANLINEQNAQVRTDSVDEAFLIYLKVSFVCGFVIASPYIFYELWLFVAAGLYPHERKYVYTYLPMSLGLFLGGAALCFFAVIPIVLDFLFGFNAWLELRPEMKISSWLSFVIILPLMFGVSFQLPLVMLFLEKINLFTVEIYRSYRRHAVFVIAILSMVLTPSDPVSMLMMMVPLVFLYELGIILCARQTAGAKSPFQPQTA